MRKHGIFALLLLLAALCLTLPAAACEFGDCTLTHPDPIPAEAVELPAEGETDLMAEPDYEGAIEAVRQAIWNGEASVALSEYALPVSQAAMQAMADELSRMPETFALSFSSCRFMHNGTNILWMDLAYTMTAEEYVAAKEFYTDAVEDVTEQVDPDWSIVETLLFVHDYLAVHYEYDMRLYEEDGPKKVNYDAYQFFRDGTGVCQAYTMAVLAILQELAIPVTYVESDNLHHIWNLVQVGDAWYHMDVTHDDPVNDHLGYARHTHFLQSDAASFTEHTEGLYPNDWIYGMDIPVEERSDTRYDGYFWRDSKSCFLNADGIWYVVTENGLTTWDGKSDSFGTLLEVDPYFDTPSSGLTLDRGTLYYNSYWDVRSYELFTGLQEIALVLDEDINALGVFAEDGILRYGYYWWVGNEFYSAEAEADLGSPYRETAGNYLYYVSEGTVHLQQEDGAQAVVACYDEDGRMVDVGLLKGSGSHRLQAAGAVKVISPDGTWSPVAVPLVGTVRRIH